MEIGVNRRTRARPHARTGTWAGFLKWTTRLLVSRCSSQGNGLRAAGRFWAPLGALGPSGLLGAGWVGSLVQGDVGLFALRPQGQAALLQLGLGVVPVLVQNELLQHRTQA